MNRFGFKQKTSRLRWIGPGWLFSFLMNALFVLAADNTTLPFDSLSLRDTKKLLLTDAVEYKQRVELATTITITMERIGNEPQVQFAREFCLDFYSSIVSELTPGAVSPAKVEEAYAKLAQTIERGKLRDSDSQIHEIIKKLNQTEPPSILALLAMKADDMRACYFVLFSDFSRGKITPYSYYVLGILAAREQRFKEADRFFEQAQSKLGAPILESWLRIDQAKVAVFSGSKSKAESLIQEILKKNDKDPRALYLLAWLQSINQKDTARQQIARLVPQLYPDPYLIADVANLSRILNDIETASKVLETFESQVDPVREFYLAFAAVRKIQQREAESSEYLRKAQKIKDTRVSVTGLYMPMEEYQKQIADIRQKQRNNIAGIAGIDPLDKFYLSLIELDVENAVQELKKVIEARKNNALEPYYLSMLYRRTGQYSNALTGFQELKQKYPDFQPYSILSHIADLSVHCDKPDLARQYYREMQTKYPDSYQAQVAKRYLNDGADKKNSTLPIRRVSPLLSRYPSYAAPFVLMEIKKNWNDLTSFSAENAALRTSSNRGLQFNEFFAVLHQTTRYKVAPFTGKKEAVLEFLREQIPVAFLQGDMFENQRLMDLALITGADPLREIFYTEGITAYDSHILTETELLEGLCVAVYPESYLPTLSDSTQKAIDAGMEFVKLHTEAAMIHKDGTFDSTDFSNRRQTLLSEKDDVYFPHKLAFARWTQRYTTPIQAEAYLQDMQTVIRQSSQYWFINSSALFSAKKLPEALESLKEAQKRDPGNRRYALAEVRTLYIENKINEAIQLTETLRFQFPEDPIISAHLIDLYKKTKDIKEQEQEEARFKKLFKDVSIRSSLDSEPTKIN